MSILEKQINGFNKTYLTVSILGKSLNLDIKYRNNPIIEINEEEKNIIMYLPKKYKTINNVKIINMAIEKMYEEIAEKEIESSMERVRLTLGFAPEDYTIERMKDSFCKVKNKTIIINPDIIKYNKKVIETTLIQAFCKTKYKTNSKAYKLALSEGIKRYEESRFNILKSVNNVKNIKKAG